MASMVFLPLLAVIVLTFICFRRERDRGPVQHPYARRVYYTALVLLGLSGLLWAFFGLGEVFGGDISGLAHLAPAAVIAILWIFAYRRPYETGITLTILSFFQAISLTIGWIGDQAGRSPNIGGLVITALPFAVTGLLLYAAGRMSRS